jgi:hypothetical protein
VRRAAKIAPHQRDDEFMIERFGQAVFFALMLAIGLAGPVRAQIGNDGDTKCYGNERFFVIARSRMNDAGTDFIIRRSTSPATKPACIFKMEAGDITVPDDRRENPPKYFLGIWNDRLVLDSGTASQNRDVSILDMNTGKVLLNLHTFNSGRIEGGTVIIDKAGPRGTKLTCANLPPDLVSLSRMVRESRVDLETFKVTKTDKVRCQYSEGG